MLRGLALVVAHRLASCSEGRAHKMIEAVVERSGRAGDSDLVGAHLADVRQQQYRHAGEVVVGVHELIPCHRKRQPKREIGVVEALVVALVLFAVLQVGEALNYASEHGNLVCGHGSLLGG